jgi:hypothetical protein
VDQIQKIVVVSSTQGGSKLSTQPKGKQKQCESPAFTYPKLEKSNHSTLVVTGQFYQHKKEAILINYDQLNYKKEREGRKIARRTMSITKTDIKRKASLQKKKVADSRTHSTHTSGDRGVSGRSAGWGL